MLSFLKIKKLSLIASSLLVGLSLLSCSKAESNDVSLLSFETEKESYAYQEQMSFKLKFDNKNNNEILNVTINDVTYPIFTYGNDYTVVYCKNDLKANEKKNAFTFDENNQIFKLSEFTYLNNDKEIKQKVSKYVNVDHNASQKSEIEITSIQFEKDDNEILNTGDEEQIGEELTLRLNLKNELSYKLTKINLSIYNNNASYEKNLSFVSQNDANSDNTIYKKTIQLPLDEGTWNIRILNYTYYKTNVGHKKIDSNIIFENCIKTKSYGIQIDEFKLSPYKQTIKKDINEEAYLSTDTVLKYQVSFKNNDKFTTTSGITDLSKEKNVKALVKYSLSDEEKATQIDFSEIKQTGSNKYTGVFNAKHSVGSSGDIELIGLIVGKVKYMFSKSLVAEGFTVYTKEITDGNMFIQNMLSDSKANEGKILGSYILGKDIALKAEQIAKLKDVDFGGYLNGNGKTINVSGNCQNGLFNNILENATIKNFKIEGGTFNDATLANKNEGQIYNIFVNVGHAIKENNLNGFVNENVGIISDIQFISKVSVLTKEKDFRFNFITKENHGIINRIIFDLSDVITVENAGILTFGIVENNDGQIATVIGEMPKFHQLMNSRLNKTSTDAMLNLYNVNLWQVMIELLKSDSEPNFWANLKSKIWEKYPVTLSEASVEKMIYVIKNIRTTYKYRFDYIPKDIEIVKENTTLNDEITEKTIDEEENDNLYYNYYINALFLGEDNAENVNYITQTNEDFYSALGFYNGVYDAFWKINSNGIKLEFPSK